MAYFVSALLIWIKLLKIPEVFQRCLVSRTDSSYGLNFSPISIGNIYRDRTKLRLDKIQSVATRSILIYFGLGYIIDAPEPLGQVGNRRVFE